MSDLDRLFYWRGIAADYINYRGEHIHVPTENRINLLKAMGVDVSSPEAIQEEAYKLDVEPWSHWFRDLIVTEEGSNCSFQINITPVEESASFNWKLFNLLNNQAVRNGSFIGTELPETGEYLFESCRYSRRKAAIGELSPGYYRLEVSSGSRQEVTTLAVHPTTVYDTENSSDDEKVWGVIIQLYTVRSQDDWGIGDFSDLALLIKKLAERGADVIGLNPLHALLPDLATYFSPYSPSDRRFINPLYIDPTKVEEYEENFGAENKEMIERLREATTVDYVAVRSLKYKVFEKLFHKFVETELHAFTSRAQDYFSYVQNLGDSILNFASYESRMQPLNAGYSQNSTEIDQSYLANFVDSFNGGAIPESLGAHLFHCYLQWIAETQLEACQRIAVEAGMKVGLIRDLAVGADGGGAEVCSNLNLFCRESAVGAPPDPLAQTGQNWGLPPVIPSELRRSGFRHFIDLLKSNMNHCGALRIDHAMSLMRLWWCPPAKTADYGAYVYYPFPEMLGLLALESYLNKCLIVGEDLGVVPDEFRAALSKMKIFSNKVFYFEKNDDGSFKHPEHYDPHSLAMVNNHDVPTLVSWWNGTDIKLRDKLQLLEEGVTYQDVCDARAKEKQMILEMLYENNLYPDSWHGQPVEKVADEELIASILLLLSKATSKIFVIQLEDLLMMDDPVNVPGTFKEHKNWQRKLSLSIEDMFSNEKTLSLLNKINLQRKQ